MATTNAVPDAANRTTARSWWQLGLGAGIAAAVVNAILFFVYQAIAGSPLQVTPPTGGGLQDLSVIMVVLLSIIPALIAALLAAALDRWVRAGRAWFIGISVALALLSLASPLALPDATTGNKLTLAVMHLVVAGFTIAALAPRFRRHRPAA